MGTKSDENLQAKDSMEGIVLGADTGLNTTAKGFRSEVAGFLDCRSGDDTVEGGHIMVPSIGQAIWFISSTKRAPSSAKDRSGTIHMVPTP